MMRVLELFAGSAIMAEFHTEASLPPEHRLRSVEPLFRRSDILSLLDELEARGGEEGAAFLRRRLEADTDG